MTAKQSSAQDSKRLGNFLALVWPHLRSRLWPIVLTVLLGVIAAFGQSAPVLLIQPLWPAMFPGEEGIETGAPSALSRFIAGLGEWITGGAEADQPRMQLVIAVAVVLAALGLLAGLAQYAFVVLSRWVGYSMVVDLRQNIARHLMGLSVRYHGRREFGDLLSRISADVQATLYSIDVLLRELVQEPALALSYLAMAIYIAPDLALTLLIALAVLAVPVAVLSRKVRKGSTRSLTSLGASVQAMSQMFQGVRTVKSFRAEERELAHYARLNDDFLRQSMKMVRSIALTRASSTLISNLGLGVMLVVMAWFVIDRDVFRNGGGVAIFFVSVAQCYNHLRRTTQGITRLQESMGAAQRLQDLLDERTDLIETRHPEPFPGLGRGIELDGVGYRYEEPLGGDSEEYWALRGIDLVIRPGEKLALVGPSGGGKSTCMDLVARFLDPTEGHVRVGGKDLRQLAISDWIDQIALVGQVPFLFHASIGDNIRYGKPDASQAEVEAAARAAHIHDFIRSLPKGYETDVADAGSRLSGGQRQRIAIARALLKRAPVLLLDEATSALDSESEQEVQQALDELMVDRTVIVIAHRLSTIRNADRIAVLEHGRLVELGTHQELLQLGGTYARLHSLQQVTAH